MKKVIVLLLILVSCSTPNEPKDLFIGNWELSKDSPDHDDVIAAGNKLTIQIEKAGIFYKVTVLANGRDPFSDAIESENTKNQTKDRLKIEREVQDQMKKFQLSPDGHILINIITPENLIVFNDANKTIQCRYGWFEKK